jgi:ascorbate-specific PTS system EIIC-type component UlaA
MSDPPPPRTDYTKPAAIIGALIGFSIIIISNPVFVVLAPLAVGAIALLFLSAGAIAGRRGGWRKAVSAPGNRY